MKKRLLAMLLCLSMCLSLLPMTAFAAVAYDIWVDGVRIGNYNQNDVLGDGNVTYDPSTKTLTFKSSVDIDDPYEDALIYAVMENDSDTLTIVGPDVGSPVNLNHWKANGIFVKTGNLAVRGSFYMECGGYGIRSYQGDVTVSGDARLQVYSDTRGIQAYRNLTITDGSTLVVETDNAGIGAASGTTTLTGQSYVSVDALYGIYGSNVVVSDSAGVSVYADHGFYADQDVTLSTSGTVYVNAVDDGIHTEYGSVTVAGSGELKVTSESFGIRTESRNLVFSGSGNVDIFGGDHAVELRGKESEMLLNGSNGTIALRSNTGNAAVNNMYDAYPHVGGTNLSKYLVTGNPDSPSVVYTLRSLVSVKDVTITGLKTPVVGEHPSTAFTVTNSEGYKLTGSAYWVKYVNGIGQDMTRADVFEAGFKYGCYLTITTEEGHPFDYIRRPGSHGTVYNAFSGTLTVNGAQMSGVVDDTFTKLDLVWWSAEPLNTDCGGDAGSCALSQFTDAPKYTNWAHKGIEYCVVKGLMSGTSATTFSPKASLTRAMLVTVLYSMEGQPGAGTAAFSDVPAGRWYSAAVSWAADNGIASGVGNGKFNPNGNVTREQIAAMLYSYAAFKGYDVTSSADISGFADAAKVSAWAQTAMRWAVAEGLISGSSSGGKTYLNPKEAATREQVAAILMRFCENVAK